MSTAPLFYDTHAHLDYPDFARDLPAVLERARQAGIGRMICVGTDLASSREAIRLSESHPEVFAAAGWHPTHVMEAPPDIRSELAELARHPKVVAIGETGLDYYRMPSRERGGSVEDDRRYRERQEQLFQQQLEVAEAERLNVIIHQRGEVLEPTLALMRPFAGRVLGQYHCYAGDLGGLEQILAMGSLVSFTGILTFKNGQNVRDALAVTPLDRFMLETDSPFLAPVPYRGKRCEPAYVRETAGVAAEVKQCTLEELSAATCATAHRFFPKLR